MTAFKHFAALIACAAMFSSVANAGYEDHPKTPELLQTLTDDYAFTPEQIDHVRSVLAQAERQPRLVEREKTAPEKTWYWYDYRPLHVNDRNVERGRAFMAEHAETLARAEAEFGVPASVIAAIMGVETKYGGYTGPHRILDSLATQGFEHPTRSPFFFSELAAFFALCRDKNLDETKLKGSYAGAMGWAQFMPSNYRNLALDYDQNGVVDLWTPADAIGSIGNYLVLYQGEGRGWRRGEQRTVDLASSVSFPSTLQHNTRHGRYNIGQLAEHGIRPADPLAADTPAGLIELKTSEHDTGRWIGLHNFYAILSYNPRTFYGMAVHDLAVALEQADAAAVAAR